MELSLATVDDYDKGVDISVIRKNYEEASTKGDTDRVVVWAGTGVGLMNQVLPAKVWHLIPQIYECLITPLNFVGHRAGTARGMSQLLEEC